MKKLIIFLILSLSLTGCKYMGQELTNEEVQQIINNIPDNSNILDKIKERERRREIERRIRERLPEIIDKRDNQGKKDNPPGQNKDKDNSGKGKGKNK